MSTANFRGPGTTPEAALRRHLNRAARPLPRPAVGAGGPCPDCGRQRRTAETLRVHRWLAHDVREAA